MTYRSNLTCPDLRPHFRLKHPPIQIFGHDTPSDPDFDPNCGYWQMDEAAILYNVALRVPGLWLDIGARFGWTAAHIAAAERDVVLVDPELRYQAQVARMERNIDHCWDRVKEVFWQDEWADMLTGYTFSGVVIDGNHEGPFPLRDAITAHGATHDDCVILLHDMWGAPIRHAASWLLDTGYQGKIYLTPNGVGVFWRGLPDFVPPEHVPDPAIPWRNLLNDAKDFDWGRMK